MVGKNHMQLVVYVLPKTKLFGNQQRARKLQSNLFNDQKINKRHPDPRLMATTETSRVVITNIKKSNYSSPPSSQPP